MNKFALRLLNSRLRRDWILATVGVLFSTSVNFGQATICQGDKIRVRRKKGGWPYYHHGIYLGCGIVIHFCGRDKKDAVVCTVSIDEFAEGGKVEVVRCAGCFSPLKTAMIAALCIGETFGGYSLLSRNCEHFANWCQTGRWESEQVSAAAADVVKSLAGVAGTRLLTGRALNGVLSALKLPPAVGILLVITTSFAGLYFYRNRERR